MPVVKPSNAFRFARVRGMSKAPFALFANVATALTQGEVLSYGVGAGRREERGCKRDLLEVVGVVNCVGSVHVGAKVGETLLVVILPRLVTRRVYSPRPKFHQRHLHYRSAPVAGAFVLALQPGPHL